MWYKLVVLEKGNSEVYEKDWGETGEYLAHEHIQSASDGYARLVWSGADVEVYESGKLLYILSIGR